MSEGYLYCFSNESMPGIYKIGMTERSPSIRLNEANNSDTWRPPTPYKLELAKKVNNAKHKESTLHKLLSQYTERINPKREFFKLSLEEVKIFFELIDGELWIDIDVSETEYDEEDDNESELNTIPIRGCRDMTKCFTNGQRIRHIIGINKIIIGKYDYDKNTIIYNDKIFKSLSSFAEYHYSIERPYRRTANGWRECECEVNSEWISTYNL
jgi:hypothetical protein